jgi:oxygen-independent coproporphyrinogen III oxidase
MIPMDLLAQENSSAEVRSYIDQYGEALLREISSRGETLRGQDIKTIYFGGGTPVKLGIDWIVRIIEHIGQFCSLEFVEELSIELNPYPADEVLQFVKDFGKSFKKFLRIRCSFGIQTFDTEVLQLTGRQSSFPGLVEFLRNLAPLKTDNMLFNFDFIAFGKSRTNKRGEKFFWSVPALEFFRTFVGSWFAESFSLYTLELFPGAAWYTPTTPLPWKKEFFGTEDEVYEEFSLLKDILLDAWYQRYEISNFSVPGRNSLHNRVYRTMQDYIGFGTSASSFVMQHVSSLPSSFTDKKPSAIRRTNTSNIFEYFKWTYIDPEKTSFLTTQDVLIEKVFLWLRMKEWISVGTENLPSLPISSVFVPDRQEKIAMWEKQWFVIFDQKKPAPYWRRYGCV